MIHISQNSKPDNQQINPCLSLENLNILSEFQKLFTQLSAYMRSYINAYVLNKPGVEANVRRLEMVADDFQAEFLNFYSPEAANILRNLLLDFIKASTNVIHDYLINDLDLVSQNVQKWYKAADDLAEYLSSINFFWDENQWKNLLHQYIQLKLEMMVALINGDSVQEIQIYDKVFELTSMMATYMARGLVAKEYQGKYRTNLA